MDQDRRRQVASGIVLIVLGLAFFGLQYVDLGRATIFFIIGGIFLAAYFARREYGFLIPGCILVGLGAGGLIHENYNLNHGVQLGLGLGFVGIYVIGLLYERKANWWPLIPGGILILVALQDARDILEMLFDYWPLILVFVGAMILVSAFVKPRRSTG